MSTVLHVAYLAPEIPAVSATFVYNEMLDLQDRRIRVSSYSVHRPPSPASEPGIERIGDTTYLYERGAARFLFDFVCNLLERPVRLVATGWKLVKDAAQFGFRSVSCTKLVYQFVAANSLARDLRRRAVQHLHIHFAHVPTQIGMYAAGLAGIPFTFTAHANDIFQRGMLLPQKAARASKVVTISDFNREFLVRAGVPREKIAVVRCGVSLTFSGVCPRMNRTTLIIGTLGRLVEKKGMDTLIRACALLSRRGTDFLLQIAGYGVLDRVLRELASELKIDDKVEFIGEMRHDRVFPWLRELDVFALACKKDRHGDTDGIPVVLMEAMGAGIPVVSTTIGGIPELIHHDLSGLLSEPEDVVKLSDNLTRVAEDHELRERLFRGGLERVRTEFSRSVNADRMYNVLMEAHGA